MRGRRSSRGRDERRNRDVRVAREARGHRRRAARRTRAGRGRARRPGRFSDRVRAGIASTEREKRGGTHFGCVAESFSRASFRLSPPVNPKRWRSYCVMMGPVAAMASSSFSLQHNTAGVQRSAKWLQLGASAAAWRCLKLPRARRRQKASTEWHAFQSSGLKTRRKPRRTRQRARRGEGTISFMLLIPGKKTGAAAGSPRSEVPNRLGTLAHPRIRRPRMPQTVLGLGGAVVGAFQEALDVFLGAKFLG